MRRFLLDFLHGRPPGVWNAFLLFGLVSNAASSSGHFAHGNLAWALINAACGAYFGGLVFREMMR